MDVRVRDIKTGVIRVITHKAYAAMGPKVYEKLGAVDATVETVNPQQSGDIQGNVHRTVNSMVVKPQIKAEQEPEPEPEPEQIEVHIEEDEPAIEPIKRKPGRQPGYRKSISSNSSKDEK